MHYNFLPVPFLSTFLLHRGLDLFLPKIPLALPPVLDRTYILS